MCVEIIKTQCSKCIFQDCMTVHAGCAIGFWKKLNFHFMIDHFKMCADQTQPGPCVSSKPKKLQVNQVVNPSSSVKRVLSTNNV